MKFSTSTVFSLLTLIGVLIFDASFTLYAFTVFLASIIKDQVEEWALSDRLGSMQNLSLLLKLITQLVVLYAKIGYIIITVILVKSFF